MNIDTINVDLDKHRIIRDDGIHHVPRTALDLIIFARSRLSQARVPTSV